MHVQLWPRRLPCTSVPNMTPAKLPLHQRSHADALDHLLAAHARGDMPPIPWLDPLTVAEIRYIQQHHALMGQLNAGSDTSHSPGGSPVLGQLLHEDSQWKPPQQLCLLLDLPSFPHVVLYQQPANWNASQVTAAPSALSAPALTLSSYSSSAIGLTGRTHLWGGSAHATTTSPGTMDPAATPVVILLDPEVSITTA